MTPDRRSGSSETVTTLHNAPSGWQAFRAFRQAPAPEFSGRHGNWKHGHYSKQSVENTRLLRACIRIIRGRLGDTSLPDFTSPVPRGWAVFREAAMSA